MRAFLIPLVLMSIVLMIPVVPFLIVGEPMEAWFENWRQHDVAPTTIAAVIIGLLATDVFLPIPSSLVSTYGGATLGIPAGTLASWCGMSLGATFGFAASKWLGRPLAVRFSNPTDLDRLEVAGERYGPLVLMVTRAIPVFAEASVLILGIHGLSWRRFLPAVLASNLGIALAYSAFGTLAAEHQWLPLALGISVALPFVFTTALRFWLPLSKETP